MMMILILDSAENFKFETCGEKEIPKKKITAVTTISTEFPLDMNDTNIIIEGERPHEL